jgi:hypothetical protein
MVVPCLQLSQTAAHLNLLLEKFSECVPGERSTQSNGQTASATTRNHRKRPAMNVAQSLPVYTLISPRVDALGVPREHQVGELHLVLNVQPPIGHERLAEVQAATTARQ